MEKFDSKQQVFDFIFVMAMRDAVMQKAYNGEKAWLWDLSKDECMYVRNEIWKFIDDQILRGKFDHQKKQEDYDKEFLRLAIDICYNINKVENSKEFTFGNAQKLINMMCKYFYILVYNDESLRKHFVCCHCPMDSIMLDIVWRKRVKDRKDQYGIFGKDFKDSWGNEDFLEENGIKNIPKRYAIFQKAVRDLIADKSGIENGIEFDYSEWE